MSFDSRRSTSGTPDSSSSSVHSAGVLAVGGLPLLSMGITPPFGPFGPWRRRLHPAGAVLPDRSPRAGSRRRRRVVVLLPDRCCGCDVRTAATKREALAATDPVVGRDFLEFVRGAQCRSALRREDDFPAAAQHAHKVDGCGPPGPGRRVALLPGRGLDLAMFAGAEAHDVASSPDTLAGEGFFSSTLVVFRLDETKSDHSPGT